MWGRQGQYDASLHHSFSYNFKQWEKKRCELWIQLHQGIWVKQKATERIRDLKSRSLLPNILLHFCQAYILTIVKLFTVFTYELLRVNTYSALGIPVIIKWVEHKEADGIIISIFCLPAKSLHLCLTICNPMDCSPPGSSIHGILQARILEWVIMPSSRESSQFRDGTPRDRIPISCLSDRFFTAELLGKLTFNLLIQINLVCAPENRYFIAGITNYQLAEGIYPVYVLLFSSAFSISCLGF